eukprot:684765-Rhodomonas_salina.1
MVLLPEQKTQHEARSLPDTQDWIDAEWIEMDTIYHMGTIMYVPTADFTAGHNTDSHQVCPQMQIRRQGPGHQEEREAGGSRRCSV